MRVAALTLIGALGLAAIAGSANAAPVVPAAAVRSPAIVDAAWGCGPGFRPVGGHWNRWGGVWIPPHCVPFRAHYWGAYPWRPYYRRYW